MIDLWIQCPVSRAAAYGCHEVGAGAGRFWATAYFDVLPRSETGVRGNEVYEWLSCSLSGSVGFEADERDMTKLRDWNPSATLMRRFCPVQRHSRRRGLVYGVPDADDPEREDEILAVTRRISGSWRRLCGQCSVSRASVRLEMQEKVKANQDLFKTVKNLFN